ncbi:MAG: hypothetical protein C0505_06940 [Leptothrix sp. (in: Bacteria)]|nr:hypothetical protein [Leptothrix sp. (in: b-proteobacteria)]
MGQAGPARPAWWSSCSSCPRTPTGPGRRSARPRHRADLLHLRHGGVDHGLGFVAGAVVLGERVGVQPQGKGLAEQPALVTPVLQVVRRAITRQLLDIARLTADEGHGGPVTLIQRFGSAANLNVQLHHQALDGVYRCDADGVPAFVETDARRDGPQVAVEVQDSACGIAADGLPQLLARFYPRREGGHGLGLGLGLANVRRIVDLHGGEVAARCAPGQGSEIRIRSAAVAAA